MTQEAKAIVSAVRSANKLRLLITMVLTIARLGPFVRIGTSLTTVAQNGAKIRGISLLWVFLLDFAYGTS
jgi:hypothetical protein